MNTMSRRKQPATPLLFARLAIASAEAIARRSLLMATGTCSPAEYRRMVAEKHAAARESARALLTGRGTATALLGPWHRRAAANAKRLRRKA